MTFDRVLATSIKNPRAFHLPVQSTSDASTSHPFPDDEKSSLHAEMLGQETKVCQKIGVSHFKPLSAKPLTGTDHRLFVCVHTASIELPASGEDRTARVKQKSTGSGWRARTVATRGFRLLQGRITREGADTPGLTAGTFCGAGQVLMVHFVLRAYLPTKTTRTSRAAQSVSLNPGVGPGFRKVQSKLYYVDSICWVVIVMSTA
uniref:(northern house mosquito) hypothetical protein n=1 Tax=Culex pipiens TaxID=7175 RepID=A0A8D8B0J4_CULPI